MKLASALENANVLVVDDMGSMREVIVAVLRNLGIRNILQAGDGHHAWCLMSEKKVDIVISDWSMPKMSGLELLQKVRASDVYKNAPFLLLTGATDKEDVKKALAFGVNDYLSKPFTPKEFEFRVIKLLSKL